MCLHAVLTSMESLHVFVFELPFVKLLVRFRNSLNLSNFSRFWAFVYHFLTDIHQWRSQPKNLGGAKKFGGAKMLDIRRITLICFEKRLSKQKMTIFSTNLGRPWSLWPPWLRLWYSWYCKKLTFFRSPFMRLPAGWIQSVRLGELFQ